MLWHLIKQNIALWYIYVYDVTEKATQGLSHRRAAHENKRTDGVTVGLQFHSFLNSTVDDTEWLAALSGCFNPEDSAVLSFLT